MPKTKLIPIMIILISVLAGLCFYGTQIMNEPEIPEVTNPQNQNLKTFIIKDHSMEPTLNIGDIVKVDLDYYKHNQPQRNDFIVFKFKTREDTFVKRVIGLTGEEVEIRNGIVYINKTEFKESYAEKDNSSFNSKIVSKDSVFVLGDNRDYSFDSRDWGFLPMSRVIGKIIIE